MANIVRIEWAEKNKEFIYGLGQLQTLYGHSKSPFTINGVSGSGLDSSKTSVPGPLKIGASTDKTAGTSGVNDIDSIEVKVEVPLQEDFQINFQSSFQTVEEMLPGGAGEFLRLGKKLTSAVGSTNDFMSIFGFQVWEKTEPIEISLELQFHTIKSGWLDVWAPIMSLSSQTILSVNNKAEVDPNSKSGIKFVSGANYSTPGVSLANAKFFTKAAKKAKASDSDKEKKKELDESISRQKSNAKTVTVTIPGILNIGTAMIKSAKPTFSKELTESGAPLWGKLDLSIQSVLPAFDGMIFDEGLGYISKLRKKDLGDKLLGFVKNQF